MGLITVLSIALAIFVAATAFLLVEFKKKDEYHTFLIDGSRLACSYEYEGGESAPGMQNIVLRSADQRPYRVLVGFDLTVGPWTMFHIYGKIQSSEDGVAVMSTWLGRSPTTFRFAVSEDVEIQTSSTPADQQLTATSIYPPHWWQKWLGLWA